MNRGEDWLCCVGFWAQRAVFGVKGLLAAHQGCFLATERHGLVHAALEMLHVWI